MFFSHQRLKVHPTFCPKVQKSFEELTQIFKSKPLIAYRRLPNLKAMLTSSSITYPPTSKPLVPTNQFIPIWTRLGKCTYCPKINKLEQITNFHTKKTFKCQSLPPKHKITSELPNVIYIINCNLCGLQYPGETKRPTRNRMYEHYSSVQKFQPEKSTPVSRHCSQKNHSVRNMEFSILHWMGDPSSPNASSRRTSQELYHIHRHRNWGGSGGSHPPNHKAGGDIFSPPPPTFCKRTKLQF